MSGPLYLHVCPYKRAETRLRRWNPSLNRATLTPANDCGSIAYRKRPLTPRPFRWAPRGSFWYVHFTAFHHLVISSQCVHLSRGLRTWIQTKSVESQARVALIITFKYTDFFSCEVLHSVPIAYVGFSKNAFTCVKRIKVLSGSFQLNVEVNAQGNYLIEGNHTLTRFRLVIYSLN